MSRKGTTTQKTGSIAKDGGIPPEQEALFQAWLTRALRMAQQGEEISAKDARLSWEVHLADGQGNVIGRAVGSSDLPGILDGAGMADAGKSVRTDLENKVLRPILTQLQDHIVVTTLRQEAEAGSIAVVHTDIEPTILNLEENAGTG